jgi:hypothetical protein
MLLKGHYRVHRANLRLPVGPEPAPEHSLTQGLNYRF